MRLASEGGGVYAASVRDRFGDHGLSGAAIVSAEGVILGFAMSCRVIGLKVEPTLMDQIAEDFREKVSELRAQIIPTDRNAPARNLYRDTGFEALEDGWWSRSLSFAAGGLAHVAAVG